MEKRKIIVVSSATQSQVAFESDATTLGELKAELDERNVDYDGMTFLEGHSKVEMNVDDAILPTNIPYKGSTTNDLVFLLTTPQKKIKSGNVDRCTIYGIIKNKNLSGPIEEKFHRHFTNISTADLLEFLKAVLGDDEDSSNENEECQNKSSEPCNENVNVEECDNDGIECLVKGVKCIISGMLKLGYIESADVTLPDEHKIISDDELNDMFGDMV